MNGIQARSISAEEHALRPACVRTPAPAGSRVQPRPDRLARAPGSGDSSDRGSGLIGSPIARAKTSSSVGRLGFRCRTCTPPSHGQRANAPLIVAGRLAAAAARTRASRLRRFRGTPARGLRAAAMNGASSPLTRTSNTRPAGPLSASMGPKVATAPLSSTTTWSQVYSTSGSRCDDEDEVDALVVREVANQLEHLVAALGVHAVGGLVEKQQVGVVHERLRQLDALLHAGRVGLDVAVARLAEADVVEHLVRALHRVGPGQARRAGRSRRRTSRRSCRECGRRSPACSRAARAPRAAFAPRSGRARRGGRTWAE